MSPPPKDLRRTILDTTATLIAEEGVRGVSFREVARRAGVSHQAPYHHFGNLSGIVGTLAQEGFRNLTRAMREACVDDADSVAALNAAGIAYVEFAKNNLGHFRVMFQKSLVDLSSEDTSLPPEDDPHAYVTSLCGRVCKEHDLPVDQAHLTLQAWALVHGIASLMVEGIMGRKGQTDSGSDDDLMHTTRVVICGFGALMSGYQGAAKDEG